MGDAKEARAEAKAAAARAKELRPWYKKKRFIIPGVIVLLIIIIVAANSGGDKTTDKTATSDTGEKAAKVAGLNEPARDGKFEFVVKGIECGKARVGSANFGKDAQGQFCFVSIKVTNIGNEPQSLFGDNQKLFDTQGREFSADSVASIYVEESKAIYEEINPGNSLEGIIVYDIPKDATPDKVELHDSAFSGGVTVKLS